MSCLDLTMRQILVQTTSVAISKEDLYQVANETSKLKLEARNFAGFTYTLARMYSGEPDKAGAIMFRMLALAQLLEEECVSEWILPKRSDGSLAAEKPLFAVAAAQPLVERGGGIGFDAISFRDEVEEYARHQGKEYLTLIDIRR